MSQRRGKRVGHAVVYGKPRQWQGWKTELRNAVLRKARAKRKAAVDKITLKAERDELARKVSKVKSTAHRITHPLERTWRNTDASGPQTTAGCQLVPERYIGKAPLVRSGRNGYCHGCGLKVHLVHGKIPEHKPGPPPCTHCPGCNAWLPAFFPQMKVKGRPREEWGAYNQMQCPNCVDQTERESITRSDTSYEDGPSYV